MGLGNLKMSIKISLRPDVQPTFIYAPSKIPPSTKAKNQAIDW